MITIATAQELRDSIGLESASSGSIAASMTFVVSISRKIFSA